MKLKKEIERLKQANRKKKTKCRKRKGSESLNINEEYYGTEIIKKWKRKNKAL